MLVQELDHAGAAESRIAQQYKASTRLLGLIGAFTEQVQDIEDALYPMCLLKSIDDSVGAQLDLIGVILNQARGPAADAQYRLMLKAKAKVDHSSGTAEDLIAVFYTVEPAATITVQTAGIAYVTVEISSALATWEAALYVQFLEKARAAGVSATLLWTADTNNLVLSDEADYPETSTTLGLGDATDPTTGGHLSGAEPT